MDVEEVALPLVVVAPALELAAVTDTPSLVTPPLDPLLPALAPAVVALEALVAAVDALSAEEVEDPASLSLSPPLASGVRPQLASAMERRPRRQAVR
ncbi:MAG: hypothetical protein KC468_02420 [Myxococcales bacterium]|nr:hypothetical protein [Myxococcales bacterium]